MGRQRKKPLPEAVSYRTAADILEVSVRTLQRWVKGGYIRAYRVGPLLVRIPRSEIARLRRHRIEHDSAPSPTARPSYPVV